MGSISAMEKVSIKGAQTEKRRPPHANVSWRYRRKDGGAFAGNGFYGMATLPHPRRAQIPRWRLRAQTFAVSVSMGAGLGVGNFTMNMQMAASAATTAQMK